MEQSRSHEGKPKMRRTDGFTLYLPDWNDTYPLAGYVSWRVLGIGVWKWLRAGRARVSQ